MGLGSASCRLEPQWETTLPRPPLEHPWPVVPSDAAKRGPPTLSGPQPWRAVLPPCGRFSLPAGSGTPAVDAASTRLCPGLVLLGITGCLSWPKHLTATAWTQSCRCPFRAGLSISWALSISGDARGSCLPARGEHGRQDRTSLFSSLMFERPHTCGLGWPRRVVGGPHLPLALACDPPHLSPGGKAEGMALSLTTQKHRGDPTHRRRLQSLKPHVLSTTFCSFTKKVCGQEELGWLQGPHLAPSNGGAPSGLGEGGGGGRGSLFPLVKGGHTLPSQHPEAPATLGRGSERHLPTCWETR